MPATPRWLLAIPDAIRQLDALDRDLLIRRDIEQLFGVSRARAATLMQTFGAEMTGYQRTLPRTKLLRQLRKHRARGAFRGEVERRDRLVAELRKARVTGIRSPDPSAIRTPRVSAWVPLAETAVGPIWSTWRRRGFRACAQPRRDRLPGGTVSGRRTQDYDAMVQLVQAVAPQGSWTVV